MSGLNWSKPKASSAIRSHGFTDKVTDRERRETDRAAKWLAKVEASKTNKRSRKRAAATEAAE